VSNSFHVRARPFANTSIAAPTSRKSWTSFSVDIVVGEVVRKPFDTEWIQNCMLRHSIVIYETSHLVSDTNATFIILSRFTLALRPRWQVAQPRVSISNFVVDYHPVPTFDSSCRRQYVLHIFFFFFFASRENNAFFCTCLQELECNDLWSRSSGSENSNNHIALSILHVTE
jgi:hypothetical protein